MCSRQTMVDRSNIRLLSGRQMWLSFRWHYLPSLVWDEESSHQGSALPRNCFHYCVHTVGKHMIHMQT